MSVYFQAASSRNGARAAFGALRHGLFILMSFAVGCRESKPAHEYGTVAMRIGSREFQLEVAATDKAREYGLMNRKSLAADHGMIFVFDIDAPREFYMKNTLIPLDIVYVNSGGSVVSIKHGKPLEESPTIPSDGPMKYAIELSGGTAADVGLRVGDKLAIPPEAREPAE